MERETKEIDSKARGLLDGAISDVMKSYYGPWVPKKSQKAASGLGAGFLPVFRKDNDKTKKSVSPSKSAPRGANDPADPTDEYLLQMQEA